MLSFKQQSAATELCFLHDLMVFWLHCSIGAFQHFRWAEMKAEMIHVDCLVTHLKKNHTSACVFEAPCCLFFWIFHKLIDFLVQHLTSNWPSVNYASSDKLSV